MSIICISRQLATLGEESAQELAKATGYRHVTREYLEAKLADRGVGPEQRALYDEKKPGLWAGISRSRDEYIHFLKTVLLEEAAAGDCIFVGRGASAVFAQVPGVLSVRLVASRDARVARTRERYKCDERAAEHLLRQTDHDRAGFHRYFFGRDWEDPAYYDLVINTTNCTAAAVAEIIGQLRKVRLTKEDDERGVRRIGELLLGNRVITALIFEKKLPFQALEVNVSGTTVKLYGFVTTPIVAQTAAEEARKVSGVGEVEQELQILPPTMMS